jgi:hypothetical protein
VLYCADACAGASWEDLLHSMIRTDVATRRKHPPFPQDTYFDWRAEIVSQLRKGSCNGSLGADHEDCSSVCLKSDVQKATPDQNSIVGLGAEVKGQNCVLQLHHVIQKRPNSTSAHFYPADDDRLRLPLLFPALTFS